MELDRLRCGSTAFAFARGSAHEIALDVILDPLRLISQEGLYGDVAMVSSNEVVAGKLLEVGLILLDGEEAVPGPF